MTGFDSFVDLLQTSIPNVQLESIVGLLEDLGGLSVSLRLVEEFDGQEGTDIGVSVQDGRRYTVRASGEVVRYPDAPSQGS